MKEKKDVETALRNALNVTTVKNVFRYSAKIASVVYPVVENPSWLLGIKAAIEMGKMIAEEAEVWADTYFDRGWTVPYGEEFNEIIVQALAKCKRQVVKTMDEHKVVHIVNLKSSKVGWVYNVKTNFIDCVYVEEATELFAIKTIRELLWKRYKDNSIVLHKRVNKETKVDEIRFDLDGSKAPLSSQLADKTSKYIQKFLDAGLTRAMMIHGPPGTGKSTMARAIVSNLKLRSFRIRVEDLGDLDNFTLSEAIHIFKPDAVILDDFDRVSDQASLLETLEFFQKNVRFIVATVNDRSRLDKALLRPGRFDEFIYVSQMDEEVVKHVLGEFSDALDTVKNWPIAYVEEYVKRRRFMSPEETLQSIEELTTRIKLLDSYENDDLKMPMFKGKKRK
jgi:hypothetical protein